MLDNPWPLSLVVRVAIVKLLEQLNDLLFFEDSQSSADRGARLVKVTYANQKTPLLTAQDAMKAKSFFPSPPALVIGDAKTTIQNAPVKLQGELEIGTQFHIHMETQVWYNSR